MPGKGQFSEKYSAFNRTSIVYSNGPGGGSGGAERWAHGTLTTDGVAGAQPNPFKHERYIHKGPHEQPSLAKVFNDDPGLRPRSLTRKHPRNVPDLKLDISDIEGTRPDPKDWYFHTARGTNPLDPQYKLPSAKAEPLPVPKFLRDPLDISDIEGTKAKPDSRAQRELRSLDVTDIPGARPAPPPAPRQRPPGAAERSALDVADICVNDPTPQQKFQQKFQQLVGGGAQQAAAQQGTPRMGAAGGGPPSPWAWGAAAGGSSARAKSAPPGPSERMSDVGVIKSVEWRRQAYEAMREQGEALRAARAEVDATLDTRAPQVASTSALSALLKGFKTFDRDRSGRLQAGEFAAVLKHASLGLSHEEVSKLVGGLRDTSGLVEYRSFMGKLFNRAQLQRQAQQVGQQGSPRLQQSPSHLSGTHHSGPLQHNNKGAAAGGGGRQPAAAAEEIQLPNWAAARQRRLSTAVAQMLNQQPAATAAEAAHVASPQWTYKSPRRFSMVKPDPSAVDRSGGSTAQRRPGSPGLEGDEAAFLAQAAGSRPGGKSGRSMSVSFRLHQPALGQQGAGSRSPAAEMPDSGFGGFGSLPEEQPEADPLFLDTTRLARAAKPRSHSWSGPAAAPRSSAGAGARAHTPGSPLSRLLPGRAEAAVEGAGIGAGAGSAQSRGSTAAAPSWHSTTTLRNGVATPTAPGLAGREAQCQSPCATAAAARARGSPGSTSSSNCGGGLPLLLPPVRLQAVQSRDALPTERHMAAERASKQMAADEIALVRSLS